MNQFEEILKQAKLTFEENKVIQKDIDTAKQQIDFEKKQSDLNKRDNKNCKYYYKTDCYSKELLDLINKYKFKIENYDKFIEFDIDDYESILEIYYCNFGNWNFKISNQRDVDIEEGIFIIDNIENKITNETVDFYCDLGCRNTGKYKLNNFLEFLSYNSVKEYIDKKYKKYIELPKLLRNKGYNVKEMNYSFTLDKPEGYLELDTDLFIKIYSAWENDWKFVVTNDKKWDVNSYNDDLYQYEKAYWFDYNSINDLDELCKCINAFKKEQEGEIGFFEDGKYYGNKDIINLFSKLENEKNLYKECWNHYLIQIEHNRLWDCRGYDEKNSVIINKYKGLEIYTQTELIFNEGFWKIGKYSNKSIITFEYDKRKNANECRLTIKNYIYDEYNNTNPIINTMEVLGTFTELYLKLKDYIYKMCEIHEVISKK